MAKLIKASGSEMPNIVTVQFVDKIPVYASINLNIKLEDDKYTWDELVLPDFALENIYTAPPSIKTNVLISHIIKGYYDDNKMTAVINNYLIDMEDPEYKSEFLAMQNVRKVAKDTAKYIVSNGLF
jgi:hypothetical protein